MADQSIGPGTVLAGRFRLEDLLQETAGAKFWRATDQILARDVAVNVIATTDRRAEALLVAARTSAAVTDGHILRVLDAAEEEQFVYVVSEWGSGVSLDRLLEEGPLPPRRAAWLVKEVAETIARAHANGVAHGRLIPENVMVTEAGSVKLIGFVVDCVLSGCQDFNEAGEPLSEHESDVMNLAALLYAALTGRWPGSAGSSVPDAPRDHGRPLRPRQVRAGIPRPLDAICDRVLNADAQTPAVPILTAHELCAALSDFIGDPAAAAPGYEATAVLDAGALRAGLDAGERPAAGSPPQESPAAETQARDSAATANRPAAVAHDQEPVQDPDQDPADNADEQPADGRDASPEAVTGTIVTGSSGDVDATQAGAPVFFDDDSGVGWVSPQSRRALRGDKDAPYRRPPPPPPLPEPEPRPLFAPDAPPRGSTRRDPDREAPAPPRGDGTGHSTGHGTGSLPRVWGPDADGSGGGAHADDWTQDTGWDSRDAGKSWLRLAAVVAAIVLLVIAVILAFNLGRSSSSTDGTAQDGPSTGADADASDVPLPINNVSDFDPQGDTNEERPELVGRAVDGDPTTAWRTMTYYNNPRLGLLKDGVGLLVDLGQATEVSRVRLTLIGRPTSLEILAADEDAAVPRSIDGLRRVAAAEDAGTDVDLELDEPVTTRYLVVWLTSLPPVSGGFAGQVAEITVLP